MDIFNNYTSDPVKERNGVEIQIGQDAFVTIARAGGKAYSRLLTKLWGDSKYVLDRKDAEAEARSDEILIEVMAKTVLLGWRGIKYKGDVLPYSEENAKLLLAIPDFRTQISRFSEDFSRFQLAVEVADEANLLPMPSGKPLGDQN